MTVGTHGSRGGPRGGSAPACAFASGLAQEGVRPPGPITSTGPTRSGGRDYTVKEAHQAKRCVPHGLVLHCRRCHALTRGRAFCSRLAPLGSL